jgi:hypothetical protein
MATDSAHLGDDPRWLLSNARELAQRVRRQQRATWFPLLVFAALTFASIPVRRYSGHYLTCRTLSAGPICRAYTNADLVYWPIALVLAYVAIAAFYIRRSRALGLGTRVRPYAIAGIIIAVALTVVAFWGFQHPLADLGPLGFHDLPDQLTSPGAAIGIALLVLARAERNRALLLLTLGYLAVVLRLTFGLFSFNPPWYAIPAVAQGSVLLLAGIGFALAQRPLRTPAT